MKAFILAALAAVTLTAAVPLYAAETGTKEWYERNGDDNAHDATKGSNGAGSVRGDK